MPSQSVASALFAEIFARCGEQLAPGELESFTLAAGDGEPISVHYDAEEQVLWLTSVFDPIGGHDVDEVLRRLLLNNLHSIASGYACALDPASAVPILQSWLSRTIVHLPDFELALERHLQAASHVRRLLTAPILNSSPTLPPGSETGYWENGSPSRGAELLAELSALLDLEQIPQVADSYRLPLHLSGMDARVELCAHGDELRLCAVLAAKAPGMTSHLSMLDWNLFASCGGGLFAVDEHGTASLVRHIPCDAQIDAHDLYQRVTHFSAAIQPFLQVLCAHSDGRHRFDAI